MSIMRKIVQVIAVLGLLFLIGCQDKEMVIQLEEDIVDLQQENAENINFFIEYSIALNDLYTGIRFLDLSSANLESANRYTLVSGYSYPTGKVVYDTARGQQITSKNRFKVARNRFTKIKDDAPTEFLRIDVANRVNQSDLYLDVNERYTSLVDYMTIVLYETNYGSKDKANENLDLYNKLIPKLNIYLDELAYLESDIDAAWDQQWYSSFQGYVSEPEGKPEITITYNPD